jgi:hypothetical protein
MADLKIDIATAFTGAKEFKKADSATSGLEKSVSKLGKALLATFGTAKVLQFAKASAKAFIEDEAAASKLANSVKNLGLAYANDDIRKYIDSLTLASGVADKELRPALQALLQVTGSVTKSQAMLSDAINISRGSGESLSTVANDLSQAYVGNLKGLRKYNLGLTKAELAASSFVDIQKRMNDLFAGASTAYLQTYAGQMQILSNTASEAQEVIGKNLVDALMLLSGNLSVEGISNDMLDLANYTGDVIYGIGVLGEKLSNLPVIGDIGFRGLIQAIPLVGGYINLLADAGASAKAAKGAFNFASGGGLGTGSTKSITDRQAAAAEAAAKKRQAELLAAQKKQTKAIKEQTALKKAGTLFDIEQIGIIAALQANVSAEDRKRLELQLAILTGNTSEASKLAGEIAKSQGLSVQLAAYLANLPDAKNPFTGWKSYLDMLEAQVRLIASIQPGGGTVMAPSYNGAAIDAITASYGSGAASAGVSKSGDVYISVAGSVVSESDLVDMVNNGLLNRSLSGSPSAIGRLKGSFAG